MATKTFSYLLPLLIGISFFSCKKEITPTVPTNESPIQFQIKKVGSEYELSWSGTNTSTFEKYEIVMLDKSIPTNFLDTVNAVNFNTFDISDQYQNQLTTLLIPNADTMYYRLFIRYDNTIRVSNEIKIGFDNVNIIKKKLYDFLFDHTTNTFFHIENAPLTIDSIIGFDYKNQVFNTNDFSGSILNKGDVGVSDSKAELFVVDFFSLSDISIFELPNLEHVENVILNSSLEIIKIASNDNDLIAILLHDSNNLFNRVYLQIRNRTTHEIFYEEEIDSDHFKTHISFFPNDPNKLLIIKEGNNTILNFDQNGITNRIDGEDIYSSIEPIFSPDGEYFIIGTSNILYLFNADLELISSSEIEYKDVAFSTDGSKIYTIEGGIIPNNKIKIRSIPELEVEKSIPIPLRAEKLLINDNQLMIYGNPLNFDFDKHILAVIEI